MENQFNLENVSRSRAIVLHEHMTETRKSFRETIDNFVKENLPEWEFTSMDLDTQPAPEFGMRPRGDMLTGSLDIKATERLPDGLFYYIDSSEDVAKDALEKMKTFLESLGFYNVDVWGSCGFGEEFGFHFVLGSYEL